MIVGPVRKLKRGQGNWLGILFQMAMLGSMAGMAAIIGNDASYLYWLFWIPVAYVCGLLILTIASGVAVFAPWLLLICCVVFEPFFIVLQRLTTKGMR